MKVVTIDLTGERAMTTLSNKTILECQHTLDIVYDNKRSKSIQLTETLERTIRTLLGINQVTRAWVKYYELVSYFGLLTIEKHRIFFNAELPGAGISAVNQYAKQHGIPFISAKKHTQRNTSIDDEGIVTTMIETRDVVPTWVASSYVEKGSTALTDYYKFVEKYPQNWIMGDNNNGDMTNRESIKEIISRAGKVDLYMHDAGLNIGSDWDHQEELNGPLHLGCAIAGFGTLLPGGSFVGKQFSFYCALSRQLISFYATLFDKFHIAKPKTSGESNLEIYLVGQGFKGITDKQMTVLYSLLDEKWDAPTDKLDPPFHQLAELVPRMEKTQCIALERQVELFKEPGIRTNPDGRMFAASWLKRYPIKKLAMSDRL